MTKIIALCGKKQSGKTTLSNYIHGHEMKRHDIIEKFLISPEGNLVVNCTFHDENGKEFEEMGVLDLQQTSDEFFQYASRRIWPLVRAYNFADSLKEICVMLFNIPPECVYGTDEQKNQIQEHLLWENMPGIITCPELWDHMHPDGESEYGVTYHKPGPMTAREFMQYFGTDVMRKMYEPIWLENCFRRIEDDKPEIAIIGDCRFLNEIEAVKNRGGKVIRLSRSLYESTHQSEIDADNYTNFDGIINNQDCSIEESCKQLIEILVDMDITKHLRQIGKFTATIKSV
jgi:hypothetical protein